jgi:hypothetical protein
MQFSQIAFMDRRIDKANSCKIWRRSRGHYRTERCMTYRRTENGLIDLNIGSFRQYGMESYNAKTITLAHVFLNTFDTCKPNAKADRTALLK